VSPLDWRRQFLDSTRGRIVTRLRRGSATVEQLAAEVGLTQNGVRVHLATLERDGWIHAEGVRRSAGPGKPATLYTLVPQAGAALSGAYRPLLLALLGSLAERERPAEVAALLRDAGRRLALELDPGGAGRLADRAVGLLESLGGAVEVAEERNGRCEVRGLGCPVGDAVAVEPRVCRAVTALLAGALDASVEEHCDRTDGPPRCRFQVSPRGR
jgi:predicted ArsR family transcriptional regulator